jgi:hypothetical protein
MRRNAIPMNNKAVKTKSTKVIIVIVINKTLIFFTS